MENEIIISSLDTNTAEGKKLLFKALECCDGLLNDLVNESIVMTDLYIDAHTLEDGITKKYRTIIFTNEGKCYATGSYGIYNMLKRIMQVYGNPTWKDGIKVTIIKEKLSGGKSKLSLKMN